MSATLASEVRRRESAERALAICERRLTAAEKALRECEAFLGARYVVEEYFEVSRVPGAALKDAS